MQTTKEDTIQFCPYNDNGKHRYFIHKISTEFESYNGIDKPYDTQVYEKVEYAVSGCNCGRALKERLNYEA